MQNVLSDKQLQFVKEATKKINMAHGSVRCGKTMGTLFAFMFLAAQCRDSQIWMIGHTASTIYDNAIRLLLERRPEGEPDPLFIFRPYCAWRKGDRQLLFRDKVISTVGAKDGGAIGAIQGKTFSLCYCDEMTLYPDNIIDMISTRLSNPHSKLIATMNPSTPTHKLKQWIDKAREGDENYYELKFTLEDNPFVEEEFKERLKKSLSGVFYKRNFLGEWCLAEGAIFDFFDRDMYVIKRPPRAADYWIVGIDYGTSNAFCALLLGVSTGQYHQDGKLMWVEKEYYWDYKKTERQKTSSEFADDMKKWLELTPVKAIYVDPSAANFKLDLQRRGLHPVNADNDVENGIIKMTSDVKSGRLLICESCPNLIREIEGYVWDPKAVAKGWDEPLKKDDHSVDALRYAVQSHRIPTLINENEQWKKQVEQSQGHDMRTASVSPLAHYGFR